MEGLSGLWDVFIFLLLSKYLHETLTRLMVTRLKMPFGVNCSLVDSAGTPVQIIPSPLWPLLLWKGAIFRLRKLATCVSVCECDLILHSAHCASSVRLHIWDRCAAVCFQLTQIESMCVRVCSGAHVSQWVRWGRVCGGSGVCVCVWGGSPAWCEVYGLACTFYCTARYWHCVHTISASWK